MERNRFPAPAPHLAPVLLEAEPEPLEIDLQRTALIVIDMQNAFVSKGGFLDLIGEVDISNAQKIIEPIKKITTAARAKGCKVIHFAEVLSPDLRDSGGPNSPFWYIVPLTTYREHPEWQDKLIFRGTWGADIIQELKPQQGDIFIEKPRYSAFFGTNLDTILKTYSIKYLVFVGATTEICVETSIRDAFHLEYFPILVSDATVNSGAPFVKEATIYNVKICFGWVTTTENVLRAME